ncbi:MAG: YihY/virulence factor BrkB family protein [Fimbriimonadaceae bacterium]|nr:YihY/virulence factor BrkB family protein [Fimbriimonadaceae bacterium]QYK56825.1 MAG: YihY/virulence factor BrkB family protein [Fimbriimonadaceae bacterium]
MDLIKKSFQEWTKDEAPRLAAALAFYVVLTLAPTLLLVIAVASIVYGEQAVQGEIFGQIEKFVGAGAAETIQSLLANNQRSGSGPWAAAIGLGALLFGASGVAVELQSSLRKIWGGDPPAGGLWVMLKERGLSLLFVLVAGSLLLVSLLVSSALRALSERVLFLGDFQSEVAYGLDIVTSFVVSTVLFAFVFKFLANARLDRRDILFGAVLTALLFNIAKYALSLYLGSSLAAGFAGAGSFLALLIWIYFVAQIFFFGAEMTKVRAQSEGRALRGPRPAP